MFGTDVLAVAATTENVKWYIQMTWFLCWFQQRYRWEKKKTNDIAYSHCQEWKGSRLNVKLKTAINPKGIHQLRNEYRWIGPKCIQIYAQTVIACTRTLTWRLVTKWVTKGSYRTLGGVSHSVLCVCLCTRPFCLLSTLSLSSPVLI